MNNIEPNDWVTFCGCTEEQVKWGNNDTPDMLTVGTIYQIEKVEPHSSHTKLKLFDIDGKFNSVCFEKLNEDWAL